MPRWQIATDVQARLLKCGGYNCDKPIGAGEAYGTVTIAERPRCADCLAKMGFTPPDTLWTAQAETDAVPEVVRDSSYYSPQPIRQLMDEMRRDGKLQAVPEGDR